MQETITENELATLRRFTIREDFIKELQERFARLQRRALRLQLPAPRFRIVERRDEQVPGNTGVFRSVCIVEVQGAATKVDGYVLLAVLGHQEEGFNVIRTVATAQHAESLHERFGKVSPSCDFCHTTRQRNDTFLLWNPDERTYKQVGRNCLQFFFPSIDPNVIAENLELLLDAVDYCEDLQAQDRDDYGDTLHRRGSQRYSVKVVLQYTCAVVRSFGGAYISRRAQEERNLSTTTADEVRLAFWGKDKRPAVTNVDENTAEAIIAWARTELVPSSDYEYNLQKLLSLDTVDENHVAFVVSAWASFFRAKEREAKRQAQREEFAHSEWVGKEGEMQNFADVRVFWQKEFYHEEYGVSHLFKFITSEGNLLCAFTRSEDFVQAVKVGDTVHLRAKVKQHELYQDVKQTTLSHIKLIDREYALTGKKSKKSSAAAATLAHVEQAYDAAVGF